VSDTNDPKNPWGSSGRKDDSNDVWNKKRPNPADDLFDKFQEQLKKMMDNGGGGPSNPSASFYKIISVIAVVLIGGWFATGFFRVQEGEVGVVLRFGEMIRSTGPGLQYHLPTPIERVIVQKVAVNNRIDGGAKVDAKPGEIEGALVLTGDENMVLISYSVFWKVKDVDEYLFTAKNPDGLILVAAESAIREVIGQSLARQALTEGRNTIATKAQELLQSLLDQYKLGVQVVSLQLQRVEPPAQVINAFNDVQASLVDADRLKNEAEVYHNQIVPVARGNAERIAQEALGYAQATVANAEGEASRFNLVYQAYKKNKSITLTRYYLESMQRVLKNAKKVILDGKQGKDVIPYLPINELAKSMKSHSEQQVAKETKEKQ
jgi:membrane protease subunit HflK